MNVGTQGYVIFRQIYEDRVFCLLSVCLDVVPVSLSWVEEKPVIELTTITN